MIRDDSLTPLQWYLSCATLFKRLLIKCDKVSGDLTMSFTYKPSRIRRARRHGFRARMATKAGRAIINRRRAKGRKDLTV